MSSLVEHGSHSGQNFLFGTQCDVEVVPNNYGLVTLRSLLPHDDFLLFFGSNRNTERFLAGIPINMVQ